MSLLNQLKNVTAQGLKPNLSLGPWRDQMEEFVAGVQEELGVLDDLRYEWHRLQTFVSWPLETPRGTELAKAGFYFAPTSDAPDGCAHFCADKFFSAWEPDDDPWNVLAENCPDCPFVLGTSNNVPLPYSYVPAGSQPNEQGQQDKSSLNLGSYLSGAMERASSVQVSSTIAQVPFSLGTAAAGIGRLWSSGSDVAPSGSVANAPAIDVAAEESLDLGGDLQVTSKIKKKGKKTATKQKQPYQAFVEDPVYTKIFDLGTEEEFPPAVAPTSTSVPADDDDLAENEQTFAPATMTATTSVQEWAALRVTVMGSVSAMRKQWEALLGTLDSRIDRIKSKVQTVSGNVERLSSHDWLHGIRDKMSEAHDQLKAQTDAVREKELLVQELDAKVLARAAEVEKLKDQERLTEECEKRVKQAESDLNRLKEDKIVMQTELAALAEALQKMGDESRDEKNKIEDKMQAARAAQRDAETQLADLQDTVERRRREINMYETQLEEFGRREEHLIARQTELDARERGLKAKEADVHSREEWLLQKEGEQRAAGGRRLTPRGSKISPRITRDGLAPIDQELESRLEEAEEDADMDSKREEMLKRYAGE